MTHEAKAVVTLKPVVMQDAPNACQVWLTVGVQSFSVGIAWETAEEGLWFKKQLIIALAAALADVERETEERVRKEYGA